MEYNDGAGLGGTEETREDGGEETLKFYYSREERIKNAPQPVKDFYSGRLKAFRPGIFKALVATKGNRFMLFALIACFCVVIMLSLFDRRNEGSASGVPVSLSAFSFEDTVYVTLKFEPLSRRCRNDGAARFDVSIEYTDADGNDAEIQRFTHIYNGAESFLRTTFRDYDIVYVKAGISLEDESTVLSCRVERR